MSSKPDDVCPVCGSPMVPRTRRSDGGGFLGCSTYPACRGIRNLPHPRSAYLAASDVLGHREGNVAVAQTSRGWLGGDQPCVNGVWLFESHPGVVPDHSGVFAAFLAAFWKQLNRGSRILLDVHVEAHIRERAVSLKNSFAKIPSTAFCAADWRFDAAEALEKQFFAEVLAHNPAAESYFIPQFPLSALSSSLEDRKMRGDFLLRTRAGLKLIEIDGSQHASGEGKMNDSARDAALRAVGIETLRVTPKGVSQKAKEIAAIIPTVGANLEPEQFSHILTFALYEALSRGWISGKPESTRLAILSPCVDDEFHRMAEVALAGSLRHVTALAAICGVSELVPKNVELNVIEGAKFKEALDAQVILSLAGFPAVASNVPILLYRDLRIDLGVRLTPPPSRNIAAVPVRGSCLYFLKTFFRHDEFQEGQFEGLARVLAGEDALVLLPTGSGKSVIYQLASLLLPGTCLYISPLLSLMDDQRFNLAKRGIDNLAVINSEAAAEVRAERQEILATGELAFCFISPERVQIPEFREALHALVQHGSISCVAIDEVHCVSEWGHNFRPAYLNLGAACRQHACIPGSRPPPLLGMTGTASQAVLKDLKRDLEITDIQAVLTSSSFDRKELEFQLEHCDTGTKPQKIQEILRRLPEQFSMTQEQFFAAAGDGTAAGILFCPHVNSTHGVVEIKKVVAEIVGADKVSLYAGGQPKGIGLDQWKIIKKVDAEKFRQNLRPVMVATKAYGMGIDKPNVRYTIHYGMPASIEDFYQEAGRAGRDRKPSKCVIISSLEGGDASGGLLSHELNIGQVRTMASQVRDLADDDISRNIFFLTQSFSGADEDFAQIESVLSKYDGEGASRLISWDTDSGAAGTKAPAKGEADMARERIAKALHRLKTVGCVSDYTLDYQKRIVNVVFAPFDAQRIEAALLSYVGNFSRSLAKGMGSTFPSGKENPREYVLSMAKILVDFVYEVIEKSRRAAIFEMSQACKTGETGETLRKRILDYLNPSLVDDNLLKIGENPGSVEDYDAVFDGLMGAVHVESLRGATGRFLTDFPDAPGLLLLRGMSEVLSDGGQAPIAVDAVSRAWAARTKHGMTDRDFAEALRHVFARLKTIRRAAAKELLVACLGGSNDYTLVQALGPLAVEESERLAFVAALSRVGLSGISELFERMKELSQ